MKEVVNAQIKLSGSLYDKAATYTNLVTAVGYAGIFGVWSFARESLTARQTLWTAALLLVSLSAFVLFEVYKGFVVTTAMRRRATALVGSDPQDDLEAFLAKFNQFEIENFKDELRLARVWPWAWGAAVVFGCASIFVLLYSLLCRLVSA